jgi:L-2-hydroxyglutarate oxidase LhgO
MNQDKIYDVVIIGGGITGASILYTLSKYTNIQKIALVEKYGDVAMVQSSRTNNSQTLHSGDIETHYSFEKAKFVKKEAEYLAAYLENHPNQNMFLKVHKMALAIGKEEVEQLNIRYEILSKIFPTLEKIDKKKIAEIEPNVVKGRDPKIPMVALYNPDGFAVDYGKVSCSFVNEAKKDGVDVFFNTKIQDISHNEGIYTLSSKEKTFKAKVIIVAASSNSLTFAQKLGYGKNYILLPIAGSFFSSPKKLNGKVYMMQDPKLPFAAVHGDPYVGSPNETRYGPTAKALPYLEAGHLSTVVDFLQLFDMRFDAIFALFKVLFDPVRFKYLLRNVVYDLPLIGRFAFLKEARKVVPSLTFNEFKSIGVVGIRPQVVDVETKKLNFGAAKIYGENSIFNITPSPGASVSLANAKNDVIKIIEFLGKEYQFDEEIFEKDHIRKNN